MIRIAILDDEKADLKKEEQITRQYFYNRQAESEIATYQSVEWFLLGLTEEQFDIYILDAEMPVKNGIEVEIISGTGDYLCYESSELCGGGV